MSRKRACDYGPGYHLGPEPKRQNSDPSAFLDFRLLCPASRIGVVIGRGGNMVQEVRDVTAAKVKVEASIRGCEERVVVVASGKHAHDEWCPAQRALFLVQECINDTSQPGGEKTARMLVEKARVGCLLGKGGAIMQELRRNVPDAAIKLLPSELVPSCARPDDDLLQVTGSRAAVLEVLQRVSDKLRAHKEVPAPQLIKAHYDEGPRKGAPGGPVHIHVTASSAVRDLSAKLSGGAPRWPPRDPLREPLHCNASPPRASPWGSVPRSPPPRRASPPPRALPPPPPALDHAKRAHTPPSDQTERARLLQFGLLVPTRDVGNVLGKGGATVSRIRNATGARIKVHPTDARSQRHRVIGVHPGGALSPQGAADARTALLQIVDCMLGGAPNSPSSSPDLVTADFLVPTKKVGVIKGRGNARVARIREESGAKRVHFLTLEGRLPPGASPTHSVCQVEGTARACRLALAAITAELIEAAGLAPLRPSTAQHSAAPPPRGSSSGPGGGGREGGAAAAAGPGPGALGQQTPQQPLQLLASHPLSSPVESTRSRPEQPASPEADATFGGDEVMLSEEGPSGLALDEDVVMAPCHLESELVGETGGPAPSQEKAKEGVADSAQTKPEEAPAREQEAISPHRDVLTPGGRGRAPGDVTKVLALGRQQVACVLGKQGAAIGSIREMSRATLTLISPCKGRGEGQHELEISGNGEEVGRAEMLVQAFLMAGGASR